ncbi:hypothetical protein CPB84DRAFT_1694674 [Gymnopilus junonius]|uniref:Uncharacterized protein n=1 Tax=Gymnopilus junonius TaxID=109634 RepID=A0A9P5N6T5_GYMJU|nr:hypothetical protein CPB84DRAFT_1694674 [Gymnopilus junonius]
MLKEGEVTCYMCSKNLKVNKIRDHVAAHILTAEYGYLQFGLTTPVGEDNPCGYCGRSNTCDISIGRKRGVDSPKSHCLNYCKFSLKAAAFTTDSSPSTNHPIACQLCKKKDGRSQDVKSIVWSYNLPQNIQKEHPNAARELPGCEK